MPGRPHLHQAQQQLLELVPRSAGSGTGCSRAGRRWPSPELPSPGCDCSGTSHLQREGPVTSPVTSPNSRRWLHPHQRPCDPPETWAPPPSTANHSLPSRHGAMPAVGGHRHQHPWVFTQVVPCRCQLPNHGRSCHHQGWLGHHDTLVGTPPPAAVTVADTLWLSHARPPRPPSHKHLSPPLPPLSSRPPGPLPTSLVHPRTCF